MTQIDTKALFIGPYGENGHEFRQLVLAVLEDIIQWRRNFHPADTRLIAPADKRQETWTSTYDILLSELDRMLGELKGSAPFHNPRFIGHMHADSSIPSLLGYIRLSGSLATCVGYGGFGGTKFRPDPSRELMPRFPRMESVFAACPTEIGHLCAGIQEKRAAPCSA